MMLKVTGLSLEDIARATSSTVGAVKQKAYRAYRKLQELARGEPAIPQKFAGGRDADTKS
jgi:RNA polymerase sigma-70 factor (ECF subfamily)